MSRQTFAKICTQYDDLLKRNVRNVKSLINASTAFMIGTVLEILAGYELSLLNPSVGALRAKFLSKIPPPFDDILEDMATLFGGMVQWPTDSERRIIGASFANMTGIDNIIGCVGWTAIRMEPAETPLRTEILNMHFIADHDMRFRWVFSKCSDSLDHFGGAARNSLAEQFKNGLMKGFLIGDDSYSNMKLHFLLTPSRLLSQNNAAPARVKELSRAHQLVRTAIQRLRKQFAILDSTLKIHTTLVSHVVVLCAALYNLTKAEGEPPFDDRRDREEDR
ncbi:hypothetical protein COOONC_28190 [Cooperia oncophora]